MRIFDPSTPPLNGAHRIERAGRLLAVRDGDGRLRRIDAASTVNGPNEIYAPDDIFRDLAWLIARKKH